MIDWGAVRNSMVEQAEEKLGLSVAQQAEGSSRAAHVNLQVSYLLTALATALSAGIEAAKEKV